MCSGIYFNVLVNCYFLNVSVSQSLKFCFFGASSFKREGHSRERSPSLFRYVAPHPRRPHAVTRCPHRSISIPPKACRSGAARATAAEVRRVPRFERAMVRAIVLRESRPSRVASASDPSSPNAALGTQSARPCVGSNAARGQTKLRSTGTEYRRSLPTAITPIAHNSSPFFAIIAFPSYAQ